MLPVIALLMACRDGTDAPALRTCSVDPPDEGQIVADGPWLHDANGRRAVLRGVNAGGRSKFAPYMPFDYGDGVGLSFDEALDAYLDRAATWGLTALRVPFTWAALEPVEGADDADWLTRYDALLDGAAERGLWTIVDLHQDLYAEPLCGDGFPAWTLEDPGEPRHDCPSWFMGYMGDEEVDAAFDDLWSDARGARTGLFEMWARMAEHQAQRPGVIGLELINEPHAGSADPDVFEPEVLSPFYGELIASIRNTLPESIVFFDASGLSATTATTLLARPEGDNLVFAPHYYDAAVFLGLEADPDNVSASLARWATVGSGWGVPVLVGELGASADAPGLEGYLEALNLGLDENQLGATWWEYSDAAELWNEEDFSLVGPDGAERPTLVGAVARPHPRLIAEADPGSTTWAWVDEVFTLTLDGVAGGVSEITLPTWRYGGEAEIDVEGGCVDVRADRVYLKADGGPARLTISPPG